MNENNILAEYNYKIEIADLSYIEFKTESIENINSAIISEKKIVKYLRNISEIYHAHVELKHNHITLEIVTISRMIIINTMDAASEFIKIGDLTSAELFIAMRLNSEFLKNGLKTSEIPNIIIKKSKIDSEWINVDAFL